MHKSLSYRHQTFIVSSSVGIGLSLRFHEFVFDLSSSFPLSGSPCRLREQNHSLWGHGEPHRTHPPPHIAPRVHCRALFYMIVCNYKIYKLSWEELGMLNNIKWHKIHGLSETVDDGNIKIYKGHLYVEESYKIERVLRNTEILNNSIILLTRVEKSISVTSLIRLRVELSIEDTILLGNKIVKNGNKIKYCFKENLVNYKCDLDLAIFISQ